MDTTLHDGTVFEIPWMLNGPSSLNINFEEGYQPISNNPQPHKIDKKIDKLEYVRNEPKKRVRASAAKRYPQNVIVGFGHWVKRQL